MGKVGRRVLDLLRAGALAGGGAFLLGLWIQGLASLDLRGSYPDGLLDFLIVAVVGVALGSTLGFPAPAARPLDLLGRVAGTIVAAIAVGAALALGVAYLLAGVLDVAEHNLPYYFLPMGLVLVAVGLRRLPRTRAARLALGVPAGLLLVTRLLALSPTGAHAITRRLFPLRPAIVRAAVDEHGWGPLSHDGRTRLVTVDSTPRYHLDGRALAADAILTLTLQVARPFYQDSCGDLHTARPEPPPWVHNYADLTACLEEHPHRDEVVTEMHYHHPSECCLFGLKERHPGEIIRVELTWPFVFVDLGWRAQI